MRKTRTIVSLTMAVVLGIVTAKAETARHSFSLGGQSDNRQEFTFTVRTAGTIRIEARWTGAPDNLTLILNGPGQTGYYQRQEHDSPIVLVQDVNGDILRKGINWKASIVNFGPSVPVKGTVTITYPGEFQTQHYDRFDNLTITAVDRKAPDRAVITVEYEIERPHSRDVFVGAAIMDNGKESSAFGFRPARTEGNRGSAQVEVIYSGGESQGRFTTDQIAVFLYEANREPFLKCIYQMNLAWYR